MTYKISDFMKIIKKHADGQYDVQSAAMMAMSESNRKAKLTTEGRYAIPTENEFIAVIKDLRNK